MILSDSAILAAMAAQEIVIEPFDRNALGGNSYDVHLAPLLLVHEIKERWYGPGGVVRPLLDAKKPNPTQELLIGPEGLTLEPGTLYLGSTVEYTETHRHVPVLDGKSSIGRLGVAIHITAGFGDVGFCNHWTMELFCIEPVRIYAGMPVGQLRYHEVAGKVLSNYARKSSAKYTTRDPRPQASRMFRNFPPETKP